MPEPIDLGAETRNPLERIRETTDAGRRGVPDHQAMSGTGFQLANFVAVTSGAGLMMIVTGTKKRMLHWKGPIRRCPVCGRDSRCGCSCKRRR